MINTLQRYENRAWGLLYVGHAKEKKARTYLEYHNIPCYLPVLKKVRSKYRTIYQPMFGGYLFAAWGQEERSIVTHSPHLVNYIETSIGSDGDTIEQMQSLYKLERLSETENVDLQPREQSGKRELKTIKSGPMAGFSGYWKEINNKMQFVIIMNVLDTQFEATIDGIGLVCE